MYSATLLDHFHNPRHAGELEPPAITVEAGNPACGDVLRLSLLIENDHIREARFKARGCVPSLACSSLLTELLQGKTLGEAAALSAAEISKCIGGLPPASGHAAVLAADALQLALRKAREK